MNMLSRRITRVFCHKQCGTYSDNRRQMPIDKLLLQTVSALGLGIRVECPPGTFVKSGRCPICLNFDFEPKVTAACSLLLYILISIFAYIDVVELLTRF